MRVARIYIDQSLAEHREIELDPRAARYVQQVLRLRPGQALTLFNGDGSDWQAEITRSDRRGTYARTTGRLGDEEPPRLALHLGIGISRGERMDFAIQKSVELGVTAITPLRTERAVVQLDGDRAARRLAHWQGIAIAACEQCGRRRLPVFNPISGLAGWIASCGSGLLLDHQARQGLATATKPDEPVNLLVGPEGGLTAGERAQAVDGGFLAVHLGPRVLRTETAPLAALSTIQALWGDFRD